VICPKCGFEQAAGDECARCGVIFAKYRGRAGPLVAPLAMDAATAIPLDPRVLPPELPVVPAGTLYGVPERIAGSGPAARAGAAIAGSGLAPAGAPPLPAVTDRQRIRQLLKTQWTFSQEELLRDTLATFGSNIVAFSVVALLVLGPEVWLARYVQDRLRTAEISPLWWLGAAVAASLLMVPLATGAFTYGVLQEMRGLQPSVGECLATGLRSLFRVLLVSIFQAVAVLAGMLLCLVPGLFLLVMLYVAVPAAVEERLGPLGALRRSAQLTQGYRLHIFYLLSKLAVFQFGLSFASSFLLVLLSPQDWIRGAVTLLVNALFVGLGATATAVAYYRLRMVKEGVNANEMASVFD
jgi:hypothetical protein